MINFKMSRLKLKEEIAELVKIAVADNSNMGKTCIPIPLNRNYDVPDGYRLHVKNLGYVFFTRNGLEEDSPQECNFYPDLNEAYEIRKRMGENHSDKIKRNKRLNASNVPNETGILEYIVYRVSDE